MNSLKIKLIASQSRSKKVQVGEKMKSVPTHYKASLPDQFNSEDQDWVDAMNRVLPENEKIEIDLKQFCKLVKDQDNKDNPSPYTMLKFSIRAYFSLFLNYLNLK